MFMRPVTALCFVQWLSSGVEQHESWGLDPAFACELCCHSSPCQSLLNLCMKLLGRIQANELYASQTFSTAIVHVEITAVCNMPQF